MNEICSNRNVCHLLNQPGSFVLLVLYNLGVDAFEEASAWIIGAGICLDVKQNSEVKLREKATFPGLAVVHLAEEVREEVVLVVSTTILHCTESLHCQLECLIDKLALGTRCLFLRQIVKHRDGDVVE